MDVENELRHAFTNNPLSVDLSEFVNPMYTDEIISLSKTLGTRLKPLKEALPSEVSYMNIGTVLCYYEKGMIDILKEKTEYVEHSKEEKLEQSQGNDNSKKNSNEIVIEEDYEISF